MKIALRLVLALLIAGGCAKKTTTTPEKSKKEMATQPVAQQHAPSPQKHVVEIQPGTLEGPYAALLNYDFPKSRAALSAIEDDIRNAKAEQYGHIEAKLLAALKNPQATPAAKQFACRMLERVGSDACVPTLTALLQDPQLSHMSRFVLERLPTQAAAEALRKGLETTNGNALVGVIASVGQKRDEVSIPKLKILALNADPLVSKTAIGSLGKIGTAAAAKSLEELQSKAPKGLAEIVAEARITCARQMPRAEATEIYKALTDAKYPQSIRVAALAGLISASDRPEKVKLIRQTLEGNDEEMNASALIALAPNSNVEVRNAVAMAIPVAKPDAQLRLLTVFSDQRDVNLRPVLKQLIQNQSDESVRAAAIEALTTHGTAEDVPLLLDLAAKNSAEAKKTLQQMGAPGTDDALIALVNKDPKEARVLVIRTLASRNAKPSIPLLLKIISADDPALAGEASSALGVVGTSEQLAPLTQIVLTTNQNNVRTSAEGALKLICARTPDKESCATTLLPALHEAKTPQARISLLRVLPRLPLDKSLAALTEATKDQDDKVRDAAIRELTDWPSIAAADPLLQIAKSNDQTHAILALRGYIRLAGLKDRPINDRLAMYRTALENSKRPEEQKQALSGLGDLPTIESLEILQHFLLDPALRDDAAIAIVRLSKQLGISHNARMQVTLKELRARDGMESLRPQIDDGLKSLADIAEKTQGFIVAWMTAGPYTQAGKNGGALFDVAFAPEKGDTVNWKPLIRAADAQDLWMIDLHKIIGNGNERVAYLKTNINSTREQKAQLEIGSDDGVKVWINGKLVHANNAARPLKQADDKVKIDLKQGSNTLLVKITQGGGDWAMCARLVDANGKKITDVQVNPE